MIMEHIAHVLKKDPLEVRMANMMKSGDALLADPEYFQAENPLPQIIQDLQNSANYKDRKRFADNFNEVKPYDKKIHFSYHSPLKIHRTNSFFQQTNRFRKRGLHLMPMKYRQNYPNYDLKYPVFISVYHGDGTVAVSHAGNIKLLPQGCKPFPM
jgi:xanthine dehydrogenase/oxidase